ncbi:hypothetical protein P0R31_35180 [Bradyrhizobium yuanmingense]|uniref:hypothetical protein n=1 Tax=Bradyrhizobium yuanmingense TaxID=108015 RepID=UPI0023B8A732|nr:hypothetical protein [Bradyrhizobium yuanmingense]MDF0522485.1 hypothetical protein [Bradyrhizobium yuanmingense]
MNGNIQVDWVAMLVHCLPVLNAPIANVLRAKPHHVFAAAGCIVSPRCLAAARAFSKVFLVAIGVRRIFKAPLTYAVVRERPRMLALTLLVVQSTLVLSSFVRIRGPREIRAKNLFADSGLSHPNYELRILTVNDIISNSPTSRELVQQFESCRAPAGR